MTKDLFCEFANALRKYWNWENDLYNVGLVVDCSAAAGIADAMLSALCDGDGDWDYDPVADWGWVGIWCGSPENQAGFRRRGHWIILEDAGALYDFVCEMKNLGWPEETPKEWLK